MTVSGAYQGNNINMALFDVVTNPDDGVIHDDNTIRGKSVTIDTDIGAADDDGNNEITAGAGGISMTGDIVSGNNALTAQGSFISIDGDIAGSDNTLKVEGDGDVKVTGGITGDKASLEITGNGNMSTGDISGDSASIKVAGTGQLETGAITGEGAQVDAKGMTLTSLNDMKGATMSVAGVEATLQDTNATLDNSSITSTGNVNIGVDDAGSEETDVLSLKNGSSIAATDVVDGAGNVIYGSMNIDQNVSLDGGSSLSTKGGDLTITENATLVGDSSISSTGGNVEVSGQVKGTSSSISTAGAGSVILGSIASATEDLRIDAENGDIQVGTIEGDQGVDRLQITTNGSLSIGTSDNAALTNAQISAATGIEIGDTPGAGALLDIRGREDDAGSTLIKTDGNLVVNQSVSIHPGENESSTAGDVTVTAGGTMKFLGESTTIAGGDGNDATAYIKADGDITFDNAKGAEIGQKATVESTGGNVTMTAGEAAQNLISGVVDSAGMVSSTAGSTLIMGTESTRAEVNAKSGIFIEGTGSDNGNGVAYALVSTETGNVSMVSPKFNAVFGSEIEAVNGGVAMSEGYASVSGSNITADAGDVSITGTSAEVSNDTITASEAVIIAGTDVDGTGTGVSDVIATGNSIQIGDANTDTTIGSLGDADTLKTVLSATGNVQVDGADVVISGETEIVSSNGDAMITATGDAQISETSVSADGEVSISATGTASVDTVKLSGDTVSVSGTDASVTDSTIEGETSVVVDGTTTTNVAGTTIKNSGEVTIGESGIGTTQVESTSIAASGDVSVAGDSVTITDNQGITSTGGDVTVTAAAGSARISGGSVSADGAVKIAGATSTRVDSVAVESGADVVIGGDTAKGRTVMTDTSIDANGTVDIAGAAVKIVDNQGIDAGSGSVRIAAHGADADADTPALQVHGGCISGSGKEGISLESKEGSALVKTVVISGKEVSISGKTGTTLASVEAQDADSIKIGNGGETTVKMDSRLQADKNIEIVGDSATVAGSRVTSLDGMVKVAGSTLAKVLDVEVSGKQVEITGATVSVTGKSVTGAEKVEIVGTDSTTIGNVDVKGEGMASIGSSSGATEISDSGVAVNGQVTINGSSVAITGNEGIDAGKGGVTIAAAAGDASITGGSVKGIGAVSVSATGEATLTNVVVSGDSASITGATVSVTGKSVTGAEKVEIVGANGTTVNGVDVDGKTIAIGADGTTIINNNTTLDASGNIEVNGDSVEIAAAHIESIMDNVTITGTATGQLIDSDVSGDAVNLNGGVLTLQDGTSVKATKDDIKVVAASLTIGTQGETVPDDSMTAKKTVDITVTDGTTIQGAAQVKAEGGAVTINGGTTAANTITGKNTRVDAVLGSVSLSGNSNEVSDKAKVSAAEEVSLAGKTKNTIKEGAEVSAATEISMTSDALNQIASGAKVTSDSVTMEGGTDVRNVIKGAGTLVDASTLTMNGKENTIKEGAEVKDAKLVSMTSDALNQIASGAEVASDSVSMEGGTDGRNVIKGAGTLVDASALTMKGKENTIKEGAEVKDAVLVSMTSDALNQIASGAKVASDSVSMEGGTDGRNVIKGAGTLVDAGMVTMNGKENTIKEGATVLAGSTVDMTATTSNAILSGATVKAEGGAVTIDGGTTAANTIEGADTLVDAATNVDIDGALNTIQEGAAVMAGMNVTIDAATGNVVQGGATVTAGTSIEITAVGTAEYNGNLISDATLTATTGDINVTAAKGNEIASGAKLKATSGKVTITGTSVNLVSGADTTVTAGAVTIAGGDTAINVVDDAKVDAVGDAGTVDMDGATNIIRNGAEVLADAGITMDSNSAVAGNGNLVSASVLETENGNIELTSKLVNVIQEDARVEAIDGAVTIDGGTTALNIINDAKVNACGTDGVVTMKGESNLIADKAEVLATGNIMIDSAGTDATSGNVIDASTVQTETGNIAIQAANINLVKNGSSVDALTGEVTMKGVANLITTNAEVLAETGIDITSTGSGDNHGNKVSASTVQTETGDVDITATMHNHVTDKAGVTATKGDVNLRGKSNTIDAAAYVNAGDVAFIKADEKNTITGEDTKVTAGRTAWIQGADNEISAGALVEGEDYATIKATGDNTITGAGTKVTAGVTAQVFGENNEISAGALVNGDQYVMINAEEHNRIFGAKTVVQGGNNVQIIAGTYNVVDAASVKTTEQGGVALRAKENNIVQNGALVNTRGGSITLTSVGDDATVANTVRGEGTRLAAETYVKLDGVGNTVSSGADIRAVQEVYMTATEDNVISDSGTQVYAGETVSIDGENNIVTQEARVIGMKGVEITAAVDNTINASAQVLAMNDDASVSITAGEDNLIAGSATKVYAGADVSMTAETINLIDAATVTAMNGEVTMGNAAGTPDTVVNSIQAAGTVTAGTDVSMTGDKNAILAGSGVTAIAGSVSMTGASYNAVSGSTVKAGTNVTLDAAENNVINGASTVTAMDSVDIDAGKSNLIAESSTVTAAQNVSITGEVSNIIDASGVTAVAGAVTMRNAAGSTDDVVNSIQTGAVVTAGTDVSMTGDKNAILTGSGVTAIAGSVTMTGASYNAISESTVKAGTDVTLDAAENNVINGASTVTAGNNVAMTGVNNTITDASAVNARNDAIMDAGNNNVINGASKLTAVGSVDMDAVEGNIISDSGTQVYAGETVSIDGGNNIVTKEARVIGMKGVEITAAEDNTINASAQVLAMNDDASVSITAGEDNLIAGSATKVYAGKDVSITGEVTNTVYAASVTAKTGYITMGNAAGSTDDVVNTITAAAKVTAADDVSMTGDKNAILAGSTVTAGMDVTMTADTQNAVANSTVTANNGSITIGDVDGSTETVQNVITSEAGKTTTLTAKQNVTITGENIISSTDLGSTSIIAQNDNIIINDDNYIKYAEIDAQGAEGDVVITTGTGDKNTWIEDTSITGETVTVAGDISDDRSAANLAVVTGAEMEITSRGEDNGTGITLNNVSVLDTVKGASNIIAEAGGNIVLLNRVDVENGTLTIEDGTTSDARIVLDAGNVLNTKEASSLEGRLTGEGDINKSGGDDLLLDYDHTEFNGTIYANGAVGGAEGSVVDASNVGSWIEITSGKVGADQMAGVGEDATIVLKSTDLVINTTEAQIGTLDTTQDEAGMNNVHTTGGTLVSLGGGSDGSYTMDDNTRVDFTTVGSVLEVNMGTNGEVVHATDMKLSDATLLKLDATVDGAGQASSDIIEASGTINVAAKAGLNSTSTATAPSTARVYINHTDMAAAAKAAEGARTTIMSGTMANDINEDVLYDVAQSANGTYQRELLDRNVHLENKGDQVDLVYSKNYRSADKSDQMRKVADALREVSDAFHHSEGTLAASDNRLHNLIDAFDYTRSEGAARRGLQSVAGTGNLVPQLMLFDSSRHHLNNLRKQMEMPLCSWSHKGAPNRRTNTWVTYTGAYDSLNGDSYLGDYSRTAHGAMLGMDTSVSCNLRLGLSLGYEDSIGRADSTRVDADAFFVDAYAAGVTGYVKHRASIGLATTQFNTRRGVAVEAGYHSFYGSGRGDTEAITVNLGYEISSDYKVDERSWLTRYAALNLAWHCLDTLREQGMGEAGLESDYDKEWQADLAFGLTYNRQFTALPSQNPALFYATAAVHVELLDDRVSTNNRFHGAAASWNAASMEREPLYFEFGAGVAVPFSPSWTATGGAAVEVGPERTSFSGNIGVRYSF